MSDVTDGVCSKGDETCVYIYTSCIIVFAIIFLVFSYYRPILGKNGDKKQIESLLLAFFITPVYAAFYGYQNPMSNGSEILTAIIAFFFPLLVFCLDYKGQKVSPIEGDSV